MHFLLPVVGFIGFDHQINFDIKERLKVTNIWISEKLEKSFGNNGKILLSTGMFLGETNPIFRLIGTDLNNLTLQSQ
jgi:hypothetical protein